MPILIEKVRIKNFRSLKDIEVTLSQLTLLVGANNAGKTSFLRALNLALGIERKGVTTDDLFIDKNGEHLKDEQGNENRMIIIDVKIIPVDNDGKLVEEFEENWRSEFQNSISTNETNEFLAFRTQYLFKSQREDAKADKFKIEDWDSVISPQSADILTASLENLPLYFIDAQRDIIDDLRNRTSYFGRLATQIEYNGTDKADLETKLGTINEDAVNNSKVMSHVKTNLENLNSTLRSGGSGVEITPFPKKLRDLHKSIKIHYQDAQSDIFELDYHGMGTRSWASLLAFKAYVSWEDSAENPKPKIPFHPILALEEPEAHLHPNAQRQLYKQLKSINGQKIISTHSPYIVGLAELEEIRYFYKDIDEVKVNSIDLTGFQKSDVQNLKLDVLKYNAEIFFSKVVIMSEGNTEERVLPIFANKYFNVEAYEYGINFIGCGGNNYKLLLKILEAFQINWFIFSDYDNKNVKRGVNNALALIGINDVASSSQTICLEKNLEKYLVAEGYQNEIKQAILNSKKPFVNHFYENAQIQFVNNWTDAQILEELEKEKKFYATFYAETIANIPDENRRFPPKIKQLFEAIKEKLNITNDINASAEN